MKPTGFAVCAHTFARINLYAQDHTAPSFYRSLLQACYKINSGAGYCLALGHDTCWLCCLRAYFCARKLIRARSYAVIPQIGIAMGFLLQKMSWLRALLKGCQCWCWCCGPGRSFCELAESARLRRAAALVGYWCCCRCCQLAKRTGAGVS